MAFSCAFMAPLLLLQSWAAQQINLPRRQAQLRALSLMAFLNVRETPANGAPTSWFSYSHALPITKYFYQIITEVRVQST